MSLSGFAVVVFDLDGTIADTAPDLAAALNHVLGGLERKPLSQEAVRRLIGHGTRALLRKGLDATGSVNDSLIDANYPKLMQFYENHICDLTRPYAGVERVFDELRANGAQLAVCTNKPERMTRLLIDTLGWHKHFAAIVAGDTLAVCKPDPAPLKLAIERAGGGPAVFVGDSSIDVETARSAGVPCILVDFGMSDVPARTLGADCVVDDMGSLVSAICAL
ncbi:MAG: HAD-IA family hydrolase [Pseudomonadota bacterium]|nr:HAD-IA family hydrolase [Pseudomonadota bacterium]